MPLFKGTLIFTFSPSTENSQAYPGRSGGFSESLWFPSAVPAAGFLAWANLRSALLAPDNAIVGWRLTPYAILNNNKLVPGRSSVGVLSNPGVFEPGFTNSPTDCIRLLCEVGSVPTDFEIFIHAVPDYVIESARIALNRTYANGLVTYENMLSLGQGQLPRPLWVGRDYTQVSQRVQAVNGPGGTITCATLPGIILGTDYIRLHRVYDDVGNPIKGTFLAISAAAPVNGNTTYTVSGLPDLVRTTPSGTCRVDRMAQANITSAAIGSLSSRKVGRPSLLFRGRRGKNRP